MVNAYIEERLYTGAILGSLSGKSVSHIQYQASHTYHACESTVSANVRRESREDAAYQVSQKQVKLSTISHCGTPASRAACASKVSPPTRFPIHRTAMSFAAKATLATTALGTIGIVIFVHQQQKADQAVCTRLHRTTSTLANTYAWQAMHQGVIRDMEQQRIKRERQADFEMQRQLEEEYKKVQSVSDSTEGAVKAK